MRFLNQVTDQLNKMTEQEKDEWILAQARLTEDNSQQDFLMSLSGEKKIMYMPELKDIESFCKKIESGHIYLEYVAKYYEFDDDGRYMDDWEVWYKDPAGVMPFLNRVFRGCHDLLLLNENKIVADILDRVCRLEFRMEESDESESFDYEATFTMEDVINEGNLAMKSRDVGTDWVTSVVRLTPQWDGRELAGVLLRILEQPVCREVMPSILAKEVSPEDLFSHMLAELEAEIMSEKLTFNKMFDSQTDSMEKIEAEEKLKRKIELAEDIRLNCHV